MAETENISRRNSKDYITQALLKLMETQKVSDIPVTAVIRKAGVSRVTFYRCFASKEDVIIQYLYSVSEPSWQDYLKGQDHDLVKWLFQLLMQIKGVIQLLYSSGSSDIFYQYIKSCVTTYGDASEKDSYTRACLAGEFYGWTDEWVRRGMQATPEEMTSIAGFLSDFFKRIKVNP